MAHLITSLKAPPDIIPRLRQCYVALVKAYLTRPRPEWPGQVDLDKLAHAVEASDGPIDLHKAREAAPEITAQSERPGELHNQLRHIEVLLAAAELLAPLLGAPILCAPTQQSTSFDLEGEAWVLEAYGGDKYSNNKKLGEDLSALAKAPPQSRLFLAARAGAWPPSVLSKTDWTPIGGATKAKGICAKAEVTMVGTLRGIAVGEVRAVKVGPTRTPQDSD